MFYNNMALLKKVYTGQEILNRVFTGTALRCSSTDGGTSSATAGGKLAPVYSEQGIWNGVVDTTNWYIKLA